MDYFIETVKEYIVIFTSVLIDSIEESYNCMIVSTGPKLKQVFLVILCITVVSLALQVFNVYSIIKWQDGITALIMVTIIMSLNYIRGVQWKSSVIYKLSPLFKLREREGK